MSGLELSDEQRRTDEEAIEKTRRWIAACQVGVVFWPHEAFDRQSLTLWSTCKSHRHGKAGLEDVQD